MMNRRTLQRTITLTLAALIFAAVPAFAQAPKAEVGVTFGWVFSDGVSGNSYLVPGVGTFDRIDPKDSFGWAVDIGVFVGENAEVGFRWGQQLSKLQVDGTSTIDIGDMTVSNYHGTFGYNFGPADAPLRVYVMGGLGATSFGGVDFQTINRSGTLEGHSKFSSTWGAGVKFYGKSKIGGRAGVQFTPTYIKPDAAGWWCDPYWGCYLVGNAQYSNQFQLDGGITFKF